MGWNLAEHWWSLPSLALDLLVLGVGIAAPLRRRYLDDHGDGQAIVLLPRPHRVSPWRTAWFFAVFTGLDLVYEGTTAGRRLDALYARLPERLAAAVVRAPSQQRAIFVNFELGTRFIVLATIVALAASLVGGPWARLRMLAQAVWFVALIALVDGLAAALGSLGLPVPSPSGFAGQFVALICGVLIMLRTVFVAYALPGPTALPLAPGARGARRRNAATTVLVTVASLLLVTVPAAYLIRTASLSLRPLVILLLPLPAAGAATLVRTALLHVYRLMAAGSTAPPRESLPAVEVIVPAFNEEEWIVATLEAIDGAAVRYGGPVRAVIANDGSTDRTRELALGTIAGFRAAAGLVIDVRHGGKSATLNAALAQCTADIVIRIDADTLIGADSIRNAVPWFDDPSIGQVESLAFPRPGRSMFRKLRVFETLKIFGFTHPAMQMVGGVNVVPGMFTAFRRAPVVAMGGFTAGMNGEDADLTLRLGRLGYRSWLDPKVVIYEDVPPTLREFREQRIRWGRASIHAFARHSPFLAGLGDPRAWYTQTRMIFGKLITPIRVTAPIYILVVAAFRGPQNFVVGTAVSALLILFAVNFVLQAVLTARFGVLRRLGWMTMYLPFVMLREIFNLEALLSLPARHARFPWDRVPPAAAVPVIH